MTSETTNEGNEAILVSSGGVLYATMGDKLDSYIVATHVIDLQVQAAPGQQGVVEALVSNAAQADRSRLLGYASQLTGRVHMEARTSPKLADAVCAIRMDLEKAIEAGLIDPCIIRPVVVDGSMTGMERFGPSIFGDGAADVWTI